MCEMFSNLSTIVQTVQSKNLDHTNFTLKGKKQFFELKCAYISCHVSPFFGGWVKWMAFHNYVFTWFLLWFSRNKGWNYLPPGTNHPTLPYPLHISLTHLLILYLRQWQIACSTDSSSVPQSHKTEGCFFNIHCFILPSVSQPHSRYYSLLSGSSFYWFHFSYCLSNFI